MPKAKFKKTGEACTAPSPEHYMYPKSQTLKNKYGTKDFDTFIKKCAHDSAKAMINLRKEPLPKNFDSAYLCYIHKQLFSNTFEWAGQTRNVPFTFKDGTTAIMPGMRRTGWDNAFAIGEEIQEGLQKLDQTLTTKNNLQGLSRKEFAHEAAEMFSSLNHIHPFREGNGRTQRVFFENLAKAAGHQLDFSLVTKERMLVASVAVEEEGNLEPMKHLFEDISNPEKIRILQEFMDNVKMMELNVNDRPVMVAKEGENYTGLYRGAGFDGFALNVKGAYIIGNKDSLTPEQLKTLKLDDTLTFTPKKTEDLEKTLIPKETLAPLAENEMAEMIAEDARVHTTRDQIQHLSKIIYGSAKVLNTQMIEIIKNPSFGDQLAEQIEKVPYSVSSLAGFDLICFKNQARVNAEENVELLSAAVANYTYTVKHAKQEITQEHQTEQERRGKAVEKPSKDLQDLLSLPQELQQETLAASPLLQKELHNLIKEVNMRLSPKEHKAIKSHNYGELAQSVGISEQKAQEITNIVEKAKEVHQQLQERTPSRSNALAMAS